MPALGPAAGSVWPLLARLKLGWIPSECVATGMPAPRPTWESSSG